jgi:hypothetical protein
MSARNYASQALANEVQELEYRTRQSWRTQRRAERRAARQSGVFGWIGSELFAGMGIVWLLVNIGVIRSLENWWALFILIPAAGALTAAVDLYHSHANQTAALGSFIAGLFFLSLTNTFLFGFDFEWFWPLFLIAAGILILLGPTFGRPEADGDR